MSYLGHLNRELAAAGVGGRRRRRILTEFADHLACDPQADLGAASEVARQFADQLGTSLARRAAYASFASLAVAGSLFSIDFLTAQTRVLGSARTGALAYAGAAAALAACQVAFVAGVLGLVRALRHRHASVIPRPEAGVIVRRAAVGLAAGMITMAGLAVAAFGLTQGAPSGWRTLAFASSGTGLLVLLGATPALLAAARLRPLVEGSVGDLRQDFGSLLPPQMGRRPWMFALVVATAVAVAVAVAGVIEGDPFDGAARGLADGSACLAGFALLGRYLGLRR